MSLDLVNWRILVMKDVKTMPMAPDTSVLVSDSFFPVCWIGSGHNLKM